jgi:zinc D-Ala-D-Ala dipeptidase
MARKTKTLCFSLCSLGIDFLCNAQQPQVALSPSPALIEHNLVNVGMIYPPLLQEIRYATMCNFTGQVLYPFPTAFVHRDVAAALQKVQEELKAQGLCLKIFDGYRPFSVQTKMWMLVPDERYVSDPKKSKGKHTRGTAVDVTLVDRMGNELRMPTGYDDFSDKAHRFSSKWTTEERANSLKLEAAMKKHKFIPFPFEWWHYDYTGWEDYPPLDISFESLGRGVRTTVPAR